MTLRSALHPSWLSQLRQNPPSTWILLAALSELSFAARLPFYPALLPNADAVNYALALNQFDVRIGQTQPPGYLLYTLIGRLANQLAGDPLPALYLVSAVFGGLSVMALFLAARQIHNQAAGWVAGLLLAVNPVFWFQSILPAPYTIDFFFSAASGWLCFLAHQTRLPAALLGAALALGLAGATRPQTFVLLLPLFLYSLKGFRLRPAATAIFLAGATAGSFLAATIWLSGGLNAYLNSLTGILPLFKSSENLAKYSSFLPRYLYNTYTILSYTFTTLGELLWPFVLAGFFSLPGWKRPWQNATLRFLALWFLPTWIIYFIIWPGNSGTILVSIPPFLILAAIGFESLLRRPHLRLLAGAGLMIVLSGQVFLFTSPSEYPLGQGYRRFDNWGRMLSLVAQAGGLVRGVEELPEQGTIIYTNDYRLLQYYLPQSRLFSIPIIKTSSPDTVQDLVAIENGSIQFWNGRGVDEIIPPGVERVALVNFPPELLKVDLQYITTQSAEANRVQVISLPAGLCPAWSVTGLGLKECAPAR